MESNRKMQSYRLSAEAIADIDELAESHGMSKAEVVAQAVAAMRRAEVQREAIAWEVNRPREGSVAVSIGGMEYMGYDAADLQAAWGAWRLMESDERAEWSEVLARQPIVL